MLRITSAKLRAGREAAPAKITSSIPSPRIAEARFSPITQRSASRRFDLPQPFGPTTPVSPSWMIRSVGSTKLLKPLRRRRVKRKGVAFDDSRSVCDLLAEAGVCQHPCPRYGGVAGVFHKISAKFSGPDRLLKRKPGQWLAGNLSCPAIRSRRRGTRPTLGGRFARPGLRCFMAARPFRALCYVRRCHAPSRREGRARPGLVARARACRERGEEQVSDLVFENGWRRDFISGLL